MKTDRTQISNTNETRISRSASKLRVLVFSDAFRHRNGVGAYYDDLLRHLEPRVEIAELVCPGITASGKPQGLSIPLPSDDTQKLCLPGIPKAIKTMRRVRPNAIVIATPGPYGLLGVGLAKLFRTRLCFGYHTQYDKLANLYWNRLFGKFARRYLHALDRIFFRRACVVVANSMDTYQAALQMGADNVRLVGTPIDPRLLVPPVPHDNKVLGPVLFVGRLAHEKRIDLFLKAARDLPHVRFIVAGDGPLAQEVRQAEKDLRNLSYRGWLGREELLKTLDESEILVLPSTVEAFGTVVTEAMARERLPVVSENCGVIAWPLLAEGMEILNNGQSLTDKLNALATLPAEKREEQRRLARQRCMAFVDSTIEEWCETLIEVAWGHSVEKIENPERAE